MSVEDVEPKPLTAEKDIYRNYQREGVFHESDVVAAVQHLKNEAEKVFTPSINDTLEQLVEEAFPDVANKSGVEK